MKARMIGLLWCAVLVLLFLFSFSHAQQWIIETVDSLDWGDVGAYNSLELDDDDNPHIAYYSRSDPSNELMYTYWSSGIWNMDTVQAWATGPRPSLELDSGGNPCIAYRYPEGNYEYLIYTQKESGEWNSVSVDTQTGSYGIEGISLKLDGTGYPQISYLRAAGSIYPFPYVWKDGSGWHREYIASPSPSGWNTSLDLDAADYPHIANGDNYCYKDLSGWHCEDWSPFPFGHEVKTCSMVLDSAGFPHIAFYKRFGPSWTVEYAFKDNGGWHIENIDSLGDYDASGADISLKMDANGISHVSYFNGRDDFMYAYGKESRWHRSSVQYAGHNPGLYNSLYVSTLGYPYISYTCWSWNVENVTLRLAKANPSYCDVGVASVESPPDTVWADSTYRPRATVENYAFFLASSSVSCEIDSAGTIIYSDTQDVSNLEPNIPSQVQFDSWTVPPTPDAATYTVTIKTLLDDMVPGNNSAYKVIIPIRVFAPPDANEVPLPTEFSLSQNHPNPFNPITEIKYALPKDHHVRLDVYNISGQKVATLVDGHQKAGCRIARWEARSSSSGIYFYRLQTANFVQTRKMILLK